MINNRDIDKIVNLIVTNVKPDKIILFGSYCYGKANEDSDLDLLIIKDVNVEKHKRGRQIRKYLRGVKIPIDILVHTNIEVAKLKDDETTFISEILKSGKILYEYKRQLDI
ncbi:nucleotidyltransferase domain-containing protein [Clostridium hydrogenum]|uniref:nucleotidyltransferase domain-containing protein n=1 Tax=Clostridium hydrogenum TaxID=2855764 RepID=UPI001F48DA1A|nr:nucleotidyltransferase domain-containing protein [Clostridium hydrogenum]